MVRLPLIVSAMLLLTSCEEIAHVKIVAPPELADAGVYMDSHEVSRLRKFDDHRRVESEPQLSLPPVELRLVVYKPGCDPIHIKTPFRIGKHTVKIRPGQVACAPHAPMHVGPPLKPVVPVECVDSPFLQYYLSKSIETAAAEIEVDVSSTGNVLNASVASFGPPELFAAQMFASERAHCLEGAKYQAPPEAPYRFVVSVTSAQNRPR